MDALILILTTLFVGLTSVLSAAYTRRTKDNGDAFLFTSFEALAVFAFFLCYNKFQIRFDGYTIICSMLFAIAYITASIPLIYAMDRGSVAVTSIFVSFSLLIPTFFGIFFWKESVGFLFYIGLLLLAGSIIFMNIPAKTEKSNEEENKKRVRINPKWLLFVLLAFIGNGFCSVIQTYHQKTGGSDFKAEFMMFALVIVFVANLSIAIARNKRNITPKIKDASTGMIRGIATAIVNLGVMLLSSSGVIGQSVFFPIISVGSMIIVYICSIIIFKEKLTRNQNIGVLLGALAIVFLQI